jgi:hypothetical protein
MRPIRGIRSSFKKHTVMETQVCIITATVVVVTIITFLTGILL